MTTPNANPIPLFRPSKKRKVYRQRNHDDDFETGIEQSIPAPAPALTSAEQSLDELISSNSVPIKKEEEEEEAGIKDTLDMAEILRLRKQRRKIGGVEFRAESKIREENDTDSNGDTLVKFEEKDTEVVQPEGGLSMRRFAPQSGVVNSGVDKHMMAYIESKLGHNSQSVNSPFTHPESGTSKNEISTLQSKEPQRAPTTMGQLLEIDLGEEARVRNAHRTEMARRKAAGESIDLEEFAQNPPSKSRLGRDGKPWRGRKRRGSDDIQRDALVDAILHENRLDIYEPVPSSSLLSKEVEGPNDEILAETFRKDWEEASSHALLQRQQQMSEKAAKEKKKGSQEKTEEELYMKGPKLGGSRSARAAMREAMLKGKGVKS
ncbi:hypothetical protein SS1G_12863 [Sclerotinia sclerotiorum 1980 UF-70]|uniref:Uncharacterized protein n=1 Tax=Sclerotinia sclerotiorum (strain ATCC 18683 / 1980 / Ss-1) TaxID=665079 RepID=A7F5I5_SCLS1|nr:hypothetical protein SS1G_12863 [Sclerotinia sclerotiorum 1980 UF-70]EDN98006.1 hypothetical protein SS1G_12863 [Sclerotinia sclerotiorum 1980 UF-70]